MPDSTRNGAKTDKVLRILVVILPLVLSSSFWTYVTNSVVTPKFQLTISPDLSSTIVTNIGAVAAHQVRISIQVTGNHTKFFGFSSENATWPKSSYDLTRNLTIISADIPRLGEKGMVSVNLDSSASRIELWVSSNEKGEHLTATRAPGIPTPGFPSINALSGITSSLFWLWTILWLIIIALFVGYLILIFLRNKAPPDISKHFK